MTNAKIERIESNKAFAAKGRSFNTQATKQKYVLQSLLAFAIEQAVKHGQPGPANKLANEYLPNTGMRRKDALTYLHDHAPIRYDKKKDAFVYSKKKAETINDPEAGYNIMWWEYSRDGDNTPNFDALKDLKRTIGSLTKKEKTASENGADSLAKLYAKMRGDAEKEYEALTVAANTKQAKVVEHE